MAKTVLAEAVTSSASYTVPADKYAIFKAALIPANQTGSTATVKVANKSVAYLFCKENSNPGYSHNHMAQGPLTAGPGQTVSVTGDPIGLSGFLYDA